MDAKEFCCYRKMLKRTQKQIAQLLGTSIKAVHSYEQGWRKIPSHAERQILFLLTKKFTSSKKCWTIKRCPPKRRRQCPAYEFNSGDVCWFINGTICECREQESWQEKIVICRQCKVFRQLMDQIRGIESPGAPSI